MTDAAFSILIPGEFPGLNEVTAANRTNRFAGATQKRRATETVAQYLEACRIKPLLARRYSWRFTWYCTDRRRDPDNISSACKFVFDGLQKAGVLDNDGWSQVGEISHRFFIDQQPGVLVEAFAPW